MDDIPVIWFNLHEDVCHSPGMWDQHFLQRLLQRGTWRPAASRPFRQVDQCLDGMDGAVDGAVVVIPGSFHVEDVEAINTFLAKLSWCVVIVTSDEESRFPVDELTHPNMRLWVMTPRPGVHDQTSDRRRWIGEFYHEDTMPILEGFGVPDKSKTWFFSGQVTHERREQVAAAFEDKTGGWFNATEGFTQGLPREEYLRHMWSSKVALCPSGPTTPDSFRLYEALEAGCIPLADALCPGYDDDRYWTMLFSGDPCFPVVYEWDRAPKLARDLTREWPANSNLVQSWWQLKKRGIAQDLQEDVDFVAGPSEEPASLDDLVTVLVATSPTPSNPGTLMIEETIDSIRHHLPHAEIIVMVDGVRMEQKKTRGDAYQEYVRRLVWKTNHEMHNVVPLVFSRHTHQASMTRAALDEVKTPLIMFVEHDTPLVTDMQIEWWEVFNPILAGQVDLVRFHHEAQVLDVHMHMMPDGLQRLPDTILTRTVQWSQRPHVASSTYYREMLKLNFDEADRTMIEDIMHGVVWTAWERTGEIGWSRNRLSLYTPDGIIKRSMHTDGREGDPKYSMIHRGRVL